MGYTFARDHACVLADQIIMVNSQRSRYFGSDWVDEDFGWKGLRVRAQAEAGWSQLDTRVYYPALGLYASGLAFVDVVERSPSRSRGGQPWWSSGPAAHHRRP